MRPEVAGTLLLWFTGLIVTLTVVAVLVAVEQAKADGATGGITPLAVAAPLVGLAIVAALWAVMT